MIAVFLALSQFIEPYSDQQVKTFVEARKASGQTMENWELEAYKFKPVTPENMGSLMGDKPRLANYLRAVCVRALSSTQTQRSINKGKLRAVDFDFLAGAALKEGAIEKYQKRIAKAEQGISILEAKDIVKALCDKEDGVKKYTEQIALWDLDAGVEYYLKIQKNLPKINSSKDLPKLFEVSVVRDKSGQIIGEYSKDEVSADFQVIRRHRRRFSKKPFPVLLKQALVSIEDSRFWNFKPKGKGYEGHNGVDFKGILRALNSSGSGELQGASTITMQLAKNLILYKDVFEENAQGKRSLLRKLKEYILVEKLEKALSKDQILDWYLNTIDFGRKSQGAVTASLAYFNKSIEKLSLDEVAFLAGLPKAPNSLDPEENLKGAINRRNKVINDMKKHKFISEAQKKAARATTINFIPKEVESAHQGYASFYVSGVERQMKEWIQAYGKDPELAFDIVTPINHDYQKWAVESLQRGLLKIERSKGTLTVKPDQDRLPNLKKKLEELSKEKNETDFIKLYPEVLSKVKNSYPDGGQFILATVLSKTKFGLANGKTVKRHKNDSRRSKIVNKKKKPLAIWDVVLLQAISEKGKVHYRVASYTDVQGGIVVLDNKTGEVLATSGGFSVGAGKRYQGRNSAFVSERQPGSTVKPFAYFHALMEGLSPSVSISNKSVVLPPKKYRGQKICDSWKVRPNNGEATAYTLRQGLEKSKNALTVNTFLRSVLPSTSNLTGQADKLSLGIDKVLARMQSFGLYQKLERSCYPILLGGQEVTVLDMAGAYSAIANQGVYKKPHTLTQVTRNGVTVSPYSEGSKLNVVKSLQNVSISGKSESFNLFRLRTILQGVVARGTARRIKEWSNVIAGKTGTTNNNKDAWFVGFNKDITVAVWVGYPKGRSLGSKYEGGVAALPIFKDFMDQYYAKYPEKLKDTFSKDPQGGVIALVEPKTGFRVDKAFQADFRKYTGSKKTIVAEKEFYASENEVRKAVRTYSPRSAIAGNFFYDNLSAKFKKLLTAEAKLKRSESAKLIIRYKKAFEANDKYCKKFIKIKKHSNKPQVLQACDRAREYKDFLDRNPSSRLTLRSYYLTKYKFTN